MFLRLSRSSPDSVSDRWREFAYPSFIFVTMYLLAFFEAIIDDDCHATQKWFSICWTAVQTGISCLLVASLVGVFGRLAKIIHFVVFSLIARTYLIDLCELYVRRHFPDEIMEHGDIWLLVLRNSSWNEILEFLSENIWWDEWVFFVAFVVLFVSLLVVLVKFKLSRCRLRMSLLCLASCMAFSAYTFTSLPYQDLLAQSMFDSKIAKFYLDDLTFETLVGIGKEMPEQGRFIAKCAKSEQPFGMIVFGESATRQHWSLYGYPRRTSPRLEALSDELVVFTSVRASHWLTIQAMACMLTGRDIQHVSGRFALPSIVKSVGRTSSFASGQSHWGHIDGVDTLFFGHCAKRTYLADCYAYGSYWDHDLIDTLRDDFSVTSGVDVCFVHLMGSHFEFEKRCPADFISFPPNFDDEISKAIPCRAEKITAYDNSIAYTDKVIADMIETVRAARSCSFVLYVSDHGETPETQNRNLSQDSLWEIPMIVWLSPEYRRRFPDVVKNVVSQKDDRMTNAAVYDLVLQLLRICDTKTEG